MGYIDLHCDTLAKAFVNGEKSIYRLPENMVDVERLYHANALAQFFAIFLLPNGEQKISDDRYIESLIQILKTTIEEHPDKIGFAKNLKDLKKNQEARKVSAFLTLEDGRSVDGNMEKLEKYYDMGIRLISLTWNFENCWGAPNSVDTNIMQRGLTSFGKEAVKRMEELGMFVDVSHLSDGGFYDVADICKGPFVASHSNCRELTGVPRNLTNDMIRVIAEKGGVCGINFFGKFLSEENGDESRICDMVAHINHMINYGGEDIVAIGSDFDGISGNKFEVADPLQMEKLCYALEKEGYSQRQIEKFTYGNAMRVIGDVLR